MEASLISGVPIRLGPLRDRPNPEQERLLRPARSPVLDWLSWWLLRFREQLRIARVPGAGRPGKGPIQLGADVTLLTGPCPEVNGGAFSVSTEVDVVLLEGSGTRAARRHEAIGYERRRSATPARACPSLHCQDSPSPRSFLHPSSGALRPCLQPARRWKVIAFSI